MAVSHVFSSPIRCTRRVAVRCLSDPQRSQAHIHLGRLEPSDEGQKVASGADTEGALWEAPSGNWIKPLLATPKMVRFCTKRKKGPTVLSTDCSRVI
ncbi:hypothetical protein SKAU_G00307330 [Synaphobranchus kaupii]|uniref:Uncharacterized protein n=1 Tax=Synaphobranchus kaupii TaxID=118154 RepID=A0A9Q1IIT5_SYNKA|nr:hypothetical protein SKAU_G00307330 [Synaphobranchus kaupii]